MPAQRIIMMGPQGVGKGTHSKILAYAFKIPHISTGDIFRSNIENKTPLGLKVDSIIKKGEFVSDDITNELVADRLSQPDCKNGFILDGYPRNKKQVEFLDDYLAKHDQKIDMVFSLLATKDYLITRINKRAREEGRADDTEEAITKRLEEFDKQTKPLLDLYKDRGLITNINATGTIDDISKTLKVLIETYE